MTKLWRLLMASTVLSGLAGLGTAHAAASSAQPKPHDAAQASIILAQAQTPQSEEERRRRQGQGQQQRQDNQQQRRQDQQQQQQQHRQDQQQQQQQRQQDQQQRRQDQQQQQQQRRQDQQQQQQQQRQDQQQQQQQRRQEQDQRRQEQQQQQDQRKQEQQQRQQQQQQQQQQRRQDQQQQQDQRKQEQQQRQQDNRNNRGLPPSPPPPPPPSGAPQGGQPPAGAQSGQPPAGAQGGRNVQGVQGVQGNTNAPLTRSGVPAPTANEKPITPAGAGKGVTVQTQSGQAIQNVNDLKKERREVKEGNRTLIREPDRTIIKEGNRTIIRHDENNRFRLGARDVRVERRGNENVTVIYRPGGERIVTVVDANGYLLRRSRFLPDGREIIIIDNRPRAGIRVGNLFVVLPPPRIRIPQERYIVAYHEAPPVLLYDTLMAPPVDYIERPYSLDEIRFSPSLRDRMPRIDLDTVTFETGSWELTSDQINLLEPIANAMKRAIDQDPQTVFLIEGHTDAVGNPDDNLSLSDRRAESVAVALTEQFGVPPENLTTQGYGEQQLKVPTQGPERANRRVTVRNIGPLLAGRNDMQAPQPR